MGDDATVTTMMIVGKVFIHPTDFGFHYVEESYSSRTEQLDEGTDGEQR